MSDIPYTHVHRHVSSAEYLVIQYRTPHDIRRRKDSEHQMNQYYDIHQRIWDDMKSSQGLLAAVRMLQ